MTTPGSLAQVNADLATLSGAGSDVPPLTSSLGLVSFAARGRIDKALIRKPSFRPAACGTPLDMD